MGDEEPATRRFDLGWYERAVEALHDGVIVAGGDDLVVVSANHAARALLRRPDLVGTNLFDLVHPEDLDRAALGLSLRSDPWASAFDLRGRTPATRFRGIAGDGGIVQLEISVTTIDGPPPYIVITTRPLAVYFALDEALRLLASGATINEALACAADGYAHPFVRSAVGIAFDEIDGHRSCVGPLPPRLAGILDDGAYDDDAEAPWSIAAATSAPFVARSLDELPSSLHSAANEHGLRSCIAIPIEDRAAERSASLMVWSQDPEGIDHHLFLMRDRPTDVVRLALERRAQAWQIEHAANHDALTDLVNRRAFFGPLNRATPPFALLYIDLDAFKAVNDRLGHAVGDDVLVVTSKRLKHVVREHDVVARIGGDEFAVLATSVATQQQAETLAERLIHEVSAPIVIKGEGIRIGASVGIAIVSGPERTHSDDEIVQIADAALYRAKAAGRGSWRLAPVG